MITSYSSRSIHTKFSPSEGVSDGHEVLIPSTEEEAYDKIWNELDRIPIETSTQAERDGISRDFKSSLRPNEPEFDPEIRPYDTGRDHRTTDLVTREINNGGDIGNGVADLPYDVRFVRETPLERIVRETNEKNDQAKYEKSRREAEEAKESDTEGQDQDGSDSSNPTTQNPFTKPNISPHLVPCGEGELTVVVTVAPYEVLPNTESSNDDDSGIVSSDELVPIIVDGAISYVPASSLQVGVDQVVTGVSLTSPADPKVGVDLSDDPWNTIDITYKPQKPTSTGGNPGGTVATNPFGKTGGKVSPTKEPKQIIKPNNNNSPTTTSRPSGAVTRGNPTSGGSITNSNSGSSIIGKDRDFPKSLDFLVMVLL